MKQIVNRIKRWGALWGVLWSGLAAIEAGAQPIEPLFTPQKNEIRAVWLTTIKGLDWPKTQATSTATIERQKRELTDILDKLKAAHINTVLLQTRVRGNLIYPSGIETWSEAISGKAGRAPGYDPLAFAIEECHKRGMEIHAWMVAIPLGSTQVHKELGGRSIVKQRPGICKKFRDNWYLNPGHPETKHYLASLVNELVSRYDVDGVHLDYIRYPDRPKRFPDTAEFRKYGQGKTLAQWRRDNITEIVRTVHREVKHLKPWVKVSSAPLGKYRDTNRYPAGWNGYHDVYQEAQIWLKEGIQDIIFPMLYYRNNHFYPFVLDWMEQCHGRMVVPGLGIYFLHPSEGDWTLDEAERQLNFIRWAGCQGEAYFRSWFFTENIQGLYDCIREDFYPTPALVPPMTWVDNEKPSAPQDITLHQTDDGITLSWQAATDNMEGGVRYNVYASEEQPVDTDNPAHLKACYLQEKGYSMELSSYSPLRHFAVTAIDRCGNESEAICISLPDRPKARSLEELHMHKLTGPHAIK